MKLDINREKFAEAFNAAASVAPTRTTKPILTRVLCKADEDGVILVATDKELSIQLTVDDCAVSEPGSVLLDSEKVRRMLSESSEDRLTIETDEKGVAIYGVFANYRLQTEKADEFPKPSFDCGINSFTLSAEVLRQAITLTAFATDTESTRFALGGVLVEGDGNGLYAVATDSRRLARYQIECETTVRGIIPTKAISTIAKALSSGDVVVSINADSALFESAGVKMRTQLVEGRFPGWQQVIPKRDAQTIEMPAGILASLVRQAAILCNPESRGVLFSFKSGEVSLSAETADIGAGKVKAPIAYTGDDLRVQLDNRFVLDWLSRVEASKLISLDVASEREPVVLTSDSSLYVVMPMAIVA